MPGAPSSVLAPNSFLLVTMALNSSSGLQPTSFLLEGSDRTTILLLRIFDYEKPVVYNYA